MKLFQKRVVGTKIDKDEKDIQQKRPINQARPLNIFRLRCQVIYTDMCMVYAAFL